MKFDNKLILEYSKDISVLYVEDDELLRTSMSKIFARYFKNLDISVNGKEAFEMFLAYEKDNGSYYDLVITDINMPQMSGIELAEEVVKLNPTQSIIFLTAFNETEYLNKAIELGVDGFLTKPLDPKQFTRVLYKTTKAIFETHELERHYEQLENLNLQLEKQNNKLKKSLRILDSMIEQKATIQQQGSKSDKTKQETDELERYDLEQLEDLKNEDIYELQELQSEIDAAIISILGKKEFGSSLILIIDRLSRYASILSLYGFVKDIAFALEHLTHIMQNNALPSSQEKKDSIFDFLETFMFVLQKWNNNIVSSDLKGIRFLEPSILSDIKIIEAMWLDDFSNNESMEEEIEFF